MCLRKKGIYPGRNKLPEVGGINILANDWANANKSLLFEIDKTITSMRIKT